MIKSPEQPSREFLIQNKEPWFSNFLNPVQMEELEKTGELTYEITFTPAENEPLEPGQQFEVFNRRGVSHVVEIVEVKRINKESNKWAGKIRLADKVE